MSWINEDKELSAGAGFAPVRVTNMLWKINESNSIETIEQDEAKIVLAVNLFFKKSGDKNITTVMNNIPEMNPSCLNVEPKVKIIVPRNQLGFKRSFQPIEAEKFVESKTKPMIVKQA